MRKKVSILVVMVMFMVSCVMPSMSMAASGEQHANQEFVDIDVTKTTGEQISLDDVTIQNEKAKAQTRSQGMLTDEVLAGTSTLTADDSSHIWIFDVDSDRYLLTRFTSSNTNYKMRLCVVNWNTGTISPMATEYSSGQKVVGTLPKGSYAFYLYSVGSVGQNYDINYNYSARTEMRAPVYYTDDLLLIIQNAGYSGVYQNGQLNNLDIADGSPELVFSRSWTFNYPAGGHKKRKVDITDVKLHNVNPRKGNIYKYSSNYANSGAVVLLKVDVKTLYSNWRSLYENGGPLTIDKSDYRGLETPRRLDDEDVMSDTNYLVYDLVTGKVIDFYGNLNSFYTTGHDAPPVIIKIS